MIGTRVVFLILLYVSATTLTYSLEDFGLGTIEVEPLAIKSLVLEKKINITGMFDIKIKLYGDGDMYIKIRMNNVTVTMSTNDEKSLNAKIDRILRIEITLVNYGVEVARIYPNSTISLISKQEQNLVLSPVIFCLSILVPLILLLVYERKKFYGESEVAIEEVIVA